MGIFKKIKAGIPDSIKIPNELEKLCSWFDKHAYPISGEFSLYADDGKSMEHWLGFSDVSDRFGIFGMGPDGSLYAIWLDKEGHQKVVHLGSEGDELFILAENFLDFLRLLAIGYDEISLADLDMGIEEWNATIEQEADFGRNPNFQSWVEREFHVSIPQKGAEIMNITDKRFEKWIEDKIEQYS